MSLDISLKTRERTTKFCYHCGSYYSEQEEIWRCNITHNLTEMAYACGLYIPLWRPYKLKVDITNSMSYDEERELESNTIIYAHEIIELLEDGINRLISNPKTFMAMNPDNGWGSYDDLLRCAEEYLSACKKYPDAVVVAYR